MHRTQIARLKAAGKLPKNATNKDAEAIRQRGEKANSADYQREKALLTKAQREKAEIDVRERRGELVEVARVIEAQRRVMERVRAMIDGRISETCAKLGGAPSDRQEAMWRKVFGEICEQLANPLT